MREQYPFFREEDERTRAVIGADAAEADLGGEYQKPYAILTQKRLYCKNEAGNFITQSADLLKAEKGLLPGPNWFLWGAVACMALLVLMALILLMGCTYKYAFLKDIWLSLTNWSWASILTQTEGFFVCGGSIAVIILIVIKKFKDANKVIFGFAFAELIWSLIRLGFWTDWYTKYGRDFVIALPIVSLLSAILSLVGIIQDKRHTAFFITHNAGVFSFNPGLYSAAELKYFAAQVKALKAGDTNGQ